MKNQTKKWPDILGLNLQSLKVHDLPGLKKTDSGSVTTGETYSIFSGPIEHRCFDEITLTAWDHGGGFPNHILLRSQNGDNLEDAVLHLNEIFGEAEVIDEENYCWRNNQMYLELTLSEDLELEIYIRRQVELESQEFRQLFYTLTPSERS